MMDWLRRALRIKSEDEILADVQREPTIKNARKSLARADDILEAYQQAEDRRRVPR